MSLVDVASPKVWTARPTSIEANHRILSIFRSNRRMAKPPKKSRVLGLLQEGEAPVRSRLRVPRDPQQPQLPFDPIPDRVEPCLALLVSKPPQGPDWSFEVKWDGYRLAVHIEPKQVRILTRGGHDWTHRFPALKEAARSLATTTMILDGEAVVLDEQGRSDFGALQQALGGRGGKRNAGEAIFYCFDLLYFDGHDLTGMSLTERRHMLEDLLRTEAGAIRLSEEIEANGDALLKSACAHGLEGIIAKHRDRAYRSGRQGDWLKIKCTRSESFLVVGYEPSTVRPEAIASLLLAARKGDALVYVGSVGTGFTDKATRELKKQLDLIRTAKPAVAIRGKSLVFSTPTLVAEVEYRAWTTDGKLRHASFKGLRDAGDLGEVFSIET